MKYGVIVRRVNTHRLTKLGFSTLRHNYKYAYAYVYLTYACICSRQRTVNCERRSTATSDRRIADPKLSSISYWSVSAFVLVHGQWQTSHGLQWHFSGFGAYYIPFVQQIYLLAAYYYVSNRSGHVKCHPSIKGRWHYILFSKFLSLLLQSCIFMQDAVNVIWNGTHFERCRAIHPTIRGVAMGVYGYIYPLPPKKNQSK